MAEGLVVPVKTLYEKENWKIYTCEVSREYKYHFDGTDTISIAGDIPSLVLGVPYKIIADAKKTKYGLTYYVKTAMIALSNDGVGSYDTFLKNITTDRQFESIKKAYPNFVNMIIADEVADIDYKKIFGTGQKGLEKIIAKVVDNLVIAEIINEYGEFGVTFNMAKKMYKRYGNVHAIKRRMENEPYKILCSIQGISFKTADAIIKKKRPEMIDSPDRLFECLKFLLDEMENSEGSTYMNYAALYKKANALVPEAIKNMIKVLDNPEFKWNGESKRVSRKETFDKELFIAKKLLELRDSKSKKFDWGKEP
ncbi:MAG TPA: hypothetical protein DEO33_00500, partial [Rikenellaceae bacterium]|nr:hypothetical protein [Rikenellaceae bacterium]